MNLATIKIERPEGVVTQDIVDLKRQGYWINAKVIDGTLHIYWTGFHPANGPILVPEGHEIRISIYHEGP